MTISNPENSSPSIGSPRSLRALSLRVFKLVVGGVACLEVITFSLKMSMIVRAFAAPLPRPLNNWFLLYLSFLVALYMGLPIGCGLMVAKNKITTPGNRSFLWVFVLVPARLVALVVLALQLDAFHPIMAPQLLSIFLISAYYAYAYSSKKRLERELAAKGLILGKKEPPKNALDFGNGGHHHHHHQLFGNGQQDAKHSCPDVVNSLPPPVLIAELQVVDLKALKEEALKRKKSSI